MDKIKRYSRYLQYFFLAAIVVEPLGAALAWAFLDSETLRMLTSFEAEPGINWNLTDLQRLLGFVVSFIPVALNMLLFRALARLFWLYSQGFVFTQDNVKRIRQAGFLLLIGQLVSPVYQSLLSLVLTMHNSSGQHMVLINVHESDISEIITALMILVVAWVMDEGRKLKDEEALTV